ncbi:MAG: hypothetical protein J6C85_06440 [Alphaproteobacteria bacterium]|nr:hypothetical protein [Alphaproteobacteria bacterium]
MKKKTLWRWQELGRLSAYRKILDASLIALIGLVVIVLYACEGNIIFSTLFSIPILIIVYLDLIELCCAKDCFYIRRNFTSYKVYVLERGGYFLLEMIEQEPVGPEELPRSKGTTFCKVANYAAKFLETQKNLMYRPYGEKNWYLTSYADNELIKLGKRIKPTLFSPKEGLLLALNDGFAMEIPADNLYFQVDSCYLQTGEDVPLQIDDYFVVEYHGKFEVYGIALNRSTAESAKCFPVKAKVLTARNAETGIALICNQNGEYEVLARRMDLSPIGDEEISVL